MTLFVSHKKWNQYDSVNTKIAGDPAIPKDLSNKIGVRILMEIKDKVNYLSNLTILYPLQSIACGNFIYLF
ncbi:hypothetical protein BMT54_11595 [Pasteurellaceae bacterium 15-036681]|nr:hypothetical protein BMT54_11595 [Pasteurellaceae bacterium 15-036681]